MPVRRCFRMQGDHGRAVRIPVRRQGAHNRAKYWRSLVIFSVAELFAAAAIAAPIFIVMVMLVFIPWLMWGIAIHTEQLHDRDKSAWCRLVFYVVPALLGHFENAVWFAKGTGVLLHYVLALARFAFTMRGCVEIGLLRGTAEPDKYGSIPLTR